MNSGYELVHFECNRPPNYLNKLLFLIHFYSSIYKKKSVNFLSLFYKVYKKRNLNGGFYLELMIPKDRYLEINMLSRRPINLDSFIGTRFLHFESIVHIFIDLLQ